MITQTTSADKKFAENGKTPIYDSCLESLVISKKCSFPFFSVYILFQEIHFFF